MFVSCENSKRAECCQKRTWKRKDGYAFEPEDNLNVLVNNWHNDCSYLEVIRSEHWRKKYVVGIKIGYVLFTKVLSEKCGITADKKMKMRLLA